MRINMFGQSGLEANSYFVHCHNQLQVNRVQGTRIQTQPLVLFDCRENNHLQCKILTVNSYSPPFLYIQTDPDWKSQNRQKPKKTLTFESKAVVSSGSDSYKLGSLSSAPVSRNPHLPGRVELHPDRIQHVRVLPRPESSESPSPPRINASISWISTKQRNPTPPIQKPHIRKTWNSPSFLPLLSFFFTVCWVLFRLTCKSESMGFACGDADDLLRGVAGISELSGGHYHWMVRVGGVFRRGWFEQNGVAVVSWARDVKSIYDGDLLLGNGYG